MVSPIFSIGLVNSAVELADDSVHAVDNANKATNRQLPKRQRKQARKDLIKNLVNVGAPVAVGAALGASSYGTAAIPAAQMTQSLVKASGIGDLLGEIFQPLLAPFTNILGFFKEKLKDKVGIDLGKMIGFGTSIAKPVVGGSKMVTSSPMMSMFTPMSNPMAGTDLLGSILGNKGSAFIPAATQAMSSYRKGFEAYRAMPSYMPRANTQSKHYSRGLF